MAKKSPLFAGNQIPVLIGKQIRELRKEKGLSQEELAIEALIDQSYLGGIERGEHNFNVMNLIKIASALNVSTGVFLSKRIYKSIANVTPA